MGDLETLTELLLSGSITADQFTRFSNGAPLPPQYVATHIDKSQVAMGRGAKAVGPHGKLIEQKFYADPDAEQAKAEQARDAYLIGLSRYCNSLSLDTLGQTSHDEKRLGLDAVYIGLNTITQIELTEEEKESGKYGRNAKQRPLTALEAAEQTKRLVLLGGPGSGKSSFVRQLVIHEARQMRQDNPQARFPLLMTLRDLATLLPEVADPDQLTQQDKDNLIGAIKKQWTADLDQFGGGDFATNGLDAELENGRVLLVFDGLDEVAEERRHLVWLAIHTFLHDRGDQTANIDQIIVTCRTRSYTADSKLNNFTDHTLAHFTREQIGTFVDRWYTAQVTLGRFTPEQAKQKIADLQPAATADRRMIELSQNPLLLTTMAVIHQQEARLPKERVRLYKKAVDILLHRWQVARGIPISDELKAVLDDDKVIRPLLERLAYDLHQKQESHKDARLTFGETLHLLEQPNYLGDIALARQFLTYIDLRAGLLVGQGGSQTDKSKPPQYEFPHRTFQEYLAGCYLMDAGSATPILKLLREKAETQDYWRVPVQLAFEELYFNRRGRGLLSEIAHKLFFRKTTTERAQLWSAYIAKILGVEQIAEDLEIQEIDTDYSAVLQDKLGEIIINGQSALSVSERADVGRLINLVTDPREGVGVDARGVPDIVWSKSIPAGIYTIGGDKNAFRSFDSKEVAIQNDYALSIYPVTYRQFQAFLDDDGLTADQWWDGINDKYRKIGSQYFVYDNHPRDNVSWYQATAFCRWLSHKLGYDVRLPHEYEWEVAGRYSDGRFFPWGDQFDQTLANTNEGNVGSTTGVGLYPNGRHHYLGLYDMSGNVWEWCQNKYKKVENIEIDTTDDSRVLRGGSWYLNQGNARAAYRDGSFPDFRSFDLGFRVCRASPPISS